MKETERQIDYWAHMLDECKLDETDFDDVDSKSRPDLDSSSKPLQTALKVLGDDTYDEFVEDLNFLMKADADGKIKRLKDALIKQFNSGSVKIQYSPSENVDVSKFKATQNEVCISNSLKWALYKGDPKTQSENLFPADGVVKLGPPICAAAIGEQYYVIDGHHRWSQAYCFNPSAKIAAYVIRSDSFKEPDDILKFVQMEIFVHTASKKDSLPAAEGSGDKSNNLFEASDEEIKSVCVQYMDKSREEKSDSACSAQFLYPKLAGRSADSSAAYEEKRDFIADCIVKNTKLLKASARYPGQHDRAIMPQTGSDKTGVPDDHKGILKDTDVQPLDLKESKTMKKYTRKQIEESIKYWKKALGIMNESGSCNGIIRQLQYFMRKNVPLKFIANSSCMELQSVEKDGSTLVITAEPSQSKMCIHKFINMVQDAGFSSPDDIDDIVLKTPDGKKYVFYRTFVDEITSMVYGSEYRALEWIFRSQMSW